MPLFLGDRCGKTIGTNFKSILKGFFFGQITFRKNICNKKDSKINVFFYEIKKKGLMYYERGQRLVECVTNNF